MTLTLDERELRALNFCLEVMGAAFEDLTVHDLPNPDDRKVLAFDSLAMKVQLVMLSEGVGK